MRPYISIDLETTGLDRERSQILEIGAVFDDMVSPVDELMTFNKKVHYHHFEYAEPYALSMNRDLIYEISRPNKFELSTFDNAIDGLLGFIRECVVAVAKYESTQNRKYKDHKIHLAGKQVSSFDVPIIKNQVAKLLPSNEVSNFSYEFDELVHFRYIDVGSLYITDFNGYIPSLTDINTLTGRKKASHKAVDDAKDVVCAIRHKMGIPV